MILGIRDPVPVATSSPGTGTGAGSSTGAGAAGRIGAGAAGGMVAGDSNFGTSECGKGSEDGLAYGPDEGLEAR